MTPAKQEKIAKSQVRGKLTEARRRKLIEDARKCDGGFEIGAGPCDFCGATWEDECRRATPTHSDSPTQVRNG